MGGYRWWWAPARCHDLAHPWEVRRGVTRTVLLTRRWAVKVPRFHGGGGLRSRMWGLARGYLANHSEREWSGSKGVCPVRWSLLGGMVNVYPRCRPWRGQADLTPEDVDHIGFRGPTDRKASNVGILDGRVVWIDYDMSWNDRPACRHGKG